MSEGAGDVFQFLFEGDVRALRMARRRLGGGHPLHSQAPPAQSAEEQTSTSTRVKQTHRPRREVRHERTSWRAASTAKLSRKQERPKYDETLRRGASSRRGLVLARPFGDFRKSRILLVHSEGARAVADAGWSGGGRDAV